MRQPTTTLAFRLAAALIAASAAAHAVAADVAGSKDHPILKRIAGSEILRYGAKSYTYTSGRDRPAESLMNDVFDAERDLTTKEDLARLWRRGPEK